MNKTRLLLVILVLAVLVAVVTAIAMRNRSNYTPATSSTAQADQETSESKDNKEEQDGTSADKLDPAVQAYADAVAAKDLDAFVEAFAENGEVIDVNRPIRGHEAIRAWAENEVIGGSMEVLNVTSVDNSQDVLVRWTTESGSSWEAYYLFEISDGKITKVTFRYA